MGLIFSQIQSAKLLDYHNFLDIANIFANIICTKDSYMGKKCCFTYTSNFHRFHLRKYKKSI